MLMLLAVEYVFAYELSMRKSVLRLYKKESAHLMHDYLKLTVINLQTVTARMLELTHKILVQDEKQWWTRRKQEGYRTHPDRGTGLPPE